MIRDLADLEINEDIAQRDDTSNNKTHPWRNCPLGKHYVNSHPEHIPPSKEFPEGHIIIRKAHCAENKVKKIHARGLLQITGQTWNILKDHHGELSNYLIDISEHDLFDPSANICSGVRWLFRKKITASSKLHREAAWEEAIIDYKCYSDEVGQGIIPKALLKLREYLAKLEAE